MRAIRGSSLCALILIVPALFACGPKVVREPVFQRGQVEVQLRRYDEPEVSRRYEHPKTISGVRMAHILASLAYEDHKQVRHPIIRTDHVYDLAEGLAAALAKAGPEDEIIATATARDRRLGIFSDDRITALGLYVLQDQLYLDFYAIEEDLRAMERREEEYRVPLSLPGGRPAFTLIPVEAQSLRGPRTLVVDWRDSYYRKPVNLSIRSGGVRRRTVLMEAEDEVEPADLDLPSSFTDAQIQALDQLDAARRAGIVPEAEFQRRRRLILQGRLEEAGYPPDPAP
jgi:hypothetical protein